MKKVLIVLIVILLFACKQEVLSQNDSLKDDTSHTFSHNYWGEIMDINPATRSKISDKSWYEESSFYHLWINAFRDASSGSLSGDGIGDFIGIKEAIEEGYFTDLGITAIWLSPFFEGHAPDPSGNMHLYDTKDHYAVQPQFGTVDDVLAVVEAAHDRNIRVIFDFVPNHVSFKHPWFIGSKTRDGVHDDWFNWREVRPSGWTGWDDNSDWHYNQIRKEYYYGVFWDGMPDLNYNNPDVRTAMADVLIHWLNLGFDGIRVDAIKYIYEDDTTWSDHLDNLEFFQEMRSLLDLYDDFGYSKMMIAENWTTDYGNLNYYGGSASEPAFHMTLDFSGAYSVANMINNELTKERAAEIISLDNNFPQIKLGAFLSNHDNVLHRPASLYNNLTKEKLAAVFNTFTNRVPFLYYGNEIGMTGYAGDDINLRMDLPWSDVSTQSVDNTSILQWYRAIGQIRTYYKHLFLEEPDLISGGDDIFSYTFSSGDEVLLVVINLSEQIKSLSLDLSDYSGLSGDWNILLGTDSMEEITPMTARVFYKGDDVLDHFFNDTDVAESDYSISYSVNPESLNSDVKIHLEYWVDDNWSSLGDFSLTDDGTGLFRYTHAFGTDRPDGIRYYYIINDTPYGFYWSDNWDSDYIYWNFDSSNTLIDNTYYENNGYRKYDKTYIRGDIAGVNGWMNGNGLEMEHLNSYRWSVETYLSSGPYEFKFSSSDSSWDVDHYPGNSQPNLSYTVESSGMFRIDFDWRNMESWTFTPIP